MLTSYNTHEYTANEMETIEATSNKHVKESLSFKDSPCVLDATEMVLSSSVREECELPRAGVSRMGGVTGAAGAALGMSSVVSVAGWI